MKWIIVGAVVAGWSQWVSSTWADPANDEVKAETQVFVVTGTDCQGATSGSTVNCGHGHTANCEVVVLAKDDADTGEKHRVRRVFKTVNVGEDDTKDRGWLGISVGEVPESVAAHVEVKGHGVMILNVVEESPADHAGLEEHDIILTIEGEGVEADVGRTAKLIGAHKPGEQIEITVLRGGEENILQAELGTWPDRDVLKWKFDVGPLAEVEEQTKTRGKIMLRDPDGEWVFKDLGDLSKLEVLRELPDNIRALIPQAGSRSVQVFMGDGEKSEDAQVTTRIKIHRDGDVLVVEQTDDSEIVVRRTDKSGHETVNTYASEDELRDADEEAYEAYKDAADSVITSTIHVDGLEGLDDLDIEFDLGEWKENLDDWKVHLNEAIGEAHDARQHAMEQLEEVMKQWKGAAKDSSAHAWPFLLPDEGGDLEKYFGSGFVHIGKPRHTFEVRTDGTIEVRIRKGDSELVQLYTDEDDLAERNPKLHAKYRELMSAGE